jgi:rRNA maturation endonuclease Nob1
MRGFAGLQRNAVACPNCKRIVHVKTDFYVGNVFFCPMCGHDWEEKSDDDEEED